ncbi:GtrA family protein [Actinomyces ruminicola]|uniref:Putative flippase GtrA (Transmembrane translocase of bactoprenol-linked glucose) n=1 Tax=Actinomyces ruminicola TaxID=332524 RepID=A0A1G9XC50_9ACTO|nr:GtrA family protein [Actinomyces ruminicola]SDM94324.1 Putative flippase GtrA (transmembrane translocase of bactoprenol-linked glucose) [Actinomyces ruminicola]
MTSITTSGDIRGRRPASPADRTPDAVKAAAAAHRRINARLEDPARLAPRVFLHLINRIHRLLPGIVRHRVPVTFIGYALINGSGFVIDMSFLWLFYERLHWFYPLAVTVGYALAGLYSLLLNRWLNFQSHGSLTAQGSRYAVGLVSQYVIFILGLSSLLHLVGVNAELARVISACCEGIYLYALMRLWVFRGTPEPADDAT